MLKARPKKIKKENGWPAEIKRRNEEAIERNSELVIKVRNSGIDFSKFGWVGKVAIVINKQPQFINGWIKKYAPDIYDGAFKRK